MEETYAQLAHAVETVAFDVLKKSGYGINQRRRLTFERSDDEYELLLSHLGKDQSQAYPLKTIDCVTRTARDPKG